MNTRKKPVSRRNAIRFGVAAGAAGLVAPMINLGRYPVFADSERKYSARAIELMERSLVIDMTAFLTVNDTQRWEWLRDPDSYPETEWVKLKNSGIDILNMHIGPGEDFVTRLNAFIANHDDYFMRIDSVEDLERVKQSGKVGIMIGLQQSGPIQGVEDVDLLHSLGLRVMQLTYNHRTLLADGCLERNDGGLSTLGVQVVEHMNKLGVAVDSSHASDRTAMDTCEVSGKPVLITHSNCQALVPGHPLCTPDEVLHKMAATGGVMGISFIRNFVRDREPTTIEHLVDHFDHVARLVGVEHVGIGADQDVNGHDNLPPELLAKMKAVFDARYGFRDRVNIDGVEHPKRTYDLTEALIRRGYADADIESILGGNFKRVLTEIWSV